MINNVMSFKTKINNFAKNNKISPQAVLQNFLLEKLLEKISFSKYKNNFILKGGMLISSLIGINSRTTMDMDTTIKGVSLTIYNLDKIIKEIINIKTDENVKFELQKISSIRENNDYGGYRITLKSTYMDMLPTILKLDVTTGDKITYKEISYNFPMLFEDRNINILSYNLETIIAEKFESIIKRNIFNTRLRDFYDVYVLFKLYRDKIDEDKLSLAIINTSKHRNSLDEINRWEIYVDILLTNDSLIHQWNKYQKEYSYANEIQYSNLIKTLKSIGMIYSKHQFY